MNQELIKVREALGTIANLFKEFNIGSLLNLANINKTNGATPLELFSIVFNPCFQGKNLFEGVISYQLSVQEELFCLLPRLLIARMNQKAVPKHI